MEDAATRKARLKRLREEADATEAAVPAAVEEPKLKFRNYAPRDEKIEHEVVAQPEVKDFEAPQIEPEQPGDEGVRHFIATCCGNSPASVHITCKQQPAADVDVGVCKPARQHREVCPAIIQGVDAPSIHSTSLCAGAFGERGAEEAQLGPATRHRKEACKARAAHSEGNDSDNEGAGAGTLRSRGRPGGLK